MDVTKNRSQHQIKNNGQFKDFKAGCFKNL